MKNMNALNKLVKKRNKAIEVQNEIELDIDKLLRESFNPKSEEALEIIKQALIKNLTGENPIIDGFKVEKNTTKRSTKAKAMAKPKGKLSHSQQILAAIGKSKRAFTIAELSEKTKLSRIQVGNSCWALWKKGIMESTEDGIYSG